MIVLDASVVVELLTNGALADSIRSDLSSRDDSFIVPRLIGVEVMSSLRRLVAGQQQGADRTGRFLAGLAALPADGTTSRPTMPRISLWPKQPTPSSTPATRNCLKATWRGSSCSPNDCGGAPWNARWRCDMISLAPSGLEPDMQGAGSAG